MSPELLNKLNEIQLLQWLPPQLAVFTSLELEIAVVEMLPLALVERLRVLEQAVAESVDGWRAIKIAWYREAASRTWLNFRTKACNSTDKGWKRSFGQIFDRNNINVL